MSNSVFSVLDELESEAVFVIREAVAQFDKPCLLFSGGKDSIVLAHLARRAYWPDPVPFPVVHIDTGHNFPETITFRDRLVGELGLELIVGSVQQSIDEGRVAEEIGPHANRNALQSVTLLDTLTRHGFDAALGGSRREEEKSRAKERFFSHRDASGRWNPLEQRPEIWHLFNGRKKPGEHFRIFPISNWTELDVWNFIRTNDLSVPSLYFAHHRDVFRRNGTWLPHSPWTQLMPGESIETKSVRFRTCGDMPITGAMESEARTIDAVIEELQSTRFTERGTRFDDKRSESSMEDRKRDGYF